VKLLHSLRTRPYRVMGVMKVNLHLFYILVVDRGECYLAAMAALPSGKEFAGSIG
jgi:hypothetical protein